MFQFDTTTARSPAAPVAPGLMPALDLKLALGVGRRHVRMIVAAGLLGAVIAYYASGLLTPRYVATAEIYVDPGPVQGATADPITPGQDSNGFVNYVETQKLIVTSRSVLERAARDQGLDRDPDFVGSPVSSFFGRLLHPATAPAGDQVSVAARALAPHVQVARPERTFVLDINVTDKDPERAADVANAIAKAYVETVAQLRADAAQQTTAAINNRLESLRLDVIKAEQATESYKTEHGLAGARDGSTIEDQLKALQTQMAAQRARESDAHARADGADAARKTGGDLPAFATGAGLSTLTQLRTQQGEARQKLADTRTNLGPRHPQAIEAEARLKAANEAVDAELERFARAQRLEYQRAREAQIDLQRQIDVVKGQTNSDDEAMVGLRDLERKAQAAREVYGLFVERSRDAGVVQEIAPTRTKVISAAAAPRWRSFPPSGMTLAGVGFVAGLGVGFLAALWRDGALWREAPQPEPTSPPIDPEPDSAARPEPVVEETPAQRPVAQPPTPAPSPQPAMATAISRRHLVGVRARLIAHPRPQSLDTLALAGLEFATPAAGADLREFRQVLEALPSNPQERQIVAIAGANEAGERTTLAVNLALAAALAGRRVALLDATGRNARLTRAVRFATLRSVLEGGPGYNTVEGVRLVLPKATDPERGRQRPIEALDDLIDAAAYELILLDGPDPQEVEAEDLFAMADAIVGLDDRITEAKLDELGFASDALVALAAPPAAERKRA